MTRVRLAPAQWAAFCSSVQGTTAMADGGAEVIAWADAKLQAQEARAAAGRKSAQLRVYHRQDAAIVRAAGAIPLDEPRWVEMVADRVKKRGDHYGLKRMPSNVRIEETHERLKEKALHGTVHCSTTCRSA